MAKPRLMDGMMRLVNFHLGGSLYTVPMVALAGGPAKMMVLMTACALLTLLVYENLADVAVSRKAGSLSRMVRAVLGRHAAVVLRILIVLNAFGVVVAYMQTTLDVYHAIANVSPRANCLFCAVVALGFAAVYALERLCPDAADWGSLLANAALLVLLAALAWLPPYEDAGAPLDHVHAPVQPSGFSDLIVGFGPSMVFAFSSAEYVLLACGVCDEDGAMVPDVQVHREVRRVGASSVALSLALYVCVGWGGVRAFGPRVQDDILKNFELQGSGNELLSVCVLSTNALSLLLSLPVFAQALLLYLRELLQDVLPETTWSSVKQSALAQRFLDPAKPFSGCMWIVFLGLATAYQANGLLSIINLMSSCTDYAFMFVFPGLAFCASFSMSRTPFRWVANVVLVIGALVMGSLSFVEAVRSMRAATQTA